MFKKGEQEVLSDLDQSNYESDRVKIVLPEKDMPTHWYNIASDLKNPLAPPLNPGTGEPIGPEDLAPLFPMELIMQEVSTDKEIEIPEDWNYLGLKLRQIH